MEGERGIRGKRGKVEEEGERGGQRNSPEHPSPRLSNFLPTFPWQERVWGRLEVLLQEIKEQ